MRSAPPDGAGRQCPQLKNPQQQGPGEEEEEEEEEEEATPAPSIGSLGHRQRQFRIFAYATIMNRQMKTMRIATQKRARSIGENGTCGGHGKNRDITTGEFDRKIDHAHRVNYQFLTLCTFQGEGGGDKEWKGSQGEGDEKRGEREGERERKDPRSPPVTSSSSSSSSSLSFFFSLDRSHPLWWQ